MEVFTKKRKFVDEPGSLKIRKEWMCASKALSSSAFSIYLYLASSQDESVNLNQKEIENKLGIKKTTFYDAVALLEKEGYLYKDEVGTYFFTTSVEDKSLEKSILSEDEIRSFGKLSLWEIRVWCYFHFNSDLSPQKILDWYGITTDCRKNARDGIQGLRDKGILD